jgi:hypothetical protein
MTWVEEWLFFFEICYGRTTIRWEDYVKNYDLREQSLRRVLYQKMGLGIMARDRWPMYAFLAEDLELRKDFWNTNFPPEKNTRVVMHDNTGLSLMKFSHPDQQRACWSDYHAGTVAKGGIAIQPCGWIRNIPSCTGGITDSGCLEEVNIFEAQQEFTEMKDPTSKEPFLNVFEKGYRATLDAKKHGQYCMQPHFAESDKKFRGDHTLYSACVAVIRSGNERAVKQAKMSWMIKRGGSHCQSWDLALYSDLWLVWGFNVNFMYNSVH